MKLPGDVELGAESAEPSFPDQTAGWYIQDYSPPPADTVKLFEEYSHISPNELGEHLRRIRDEAWKVNADPCIALFKFVHLTLHQLPGYGFIIARLKASGKYLDIGCCMGQDLRKLVMDGVPSDNLYGTDLYSGYLTLSYDLFRDKATLKSHLRQGNILTMTSEGDILRRLTGMVDIIHLGMLLHTMDIKQQWLLIESCLGLLKSGCKTAIVGSALGHVDGAVGSDSNFLHSDRTFTKMCNDIAREAGMTLECNVFLDRTLYFNNVPNNLSTDPSRKLVFEVYKM
ncbi:hypothetical protein NLG97_g1218 [Lecanicillium saksenae]|uniref:Uncharacterized protein n=1 Tax=Lecanicillium saksenae TaxID=468837 RepID=A0ACC1R710_9HYPO|nr:hypothetical protein NLG97_g1218 [Lecanicillium saksenae]